jgi:hypothetical protein
MMQHVRVQLYRSAHLGRLCSAAKTKWFLATGVALGAEDVCGVVHHCGEFAGTLDVSASFGRQTHPGPRRPAKPTEETPMPTHIGIRLTAVQGELDEQRQLIQRQIDQNERQKGLLTIQFRRIAEIQTELDLVKIAVGLDVSQAVTVGPQLATASHSRRPNWCA